MMNPLEHLGVYGGGADERVEHHGGTVGSSVCPRGSVYRMDVRTMCGSRTGGWLLPGVMSDSQRCVD
jgi:hypothetical protein